MNINKDWAQYNLENGYVTLWQYRGIINAKVEAGELPKEYEQPRGKIISMCGGTPRIVLHPLQQAALDKINGI